jgi:hypothetical protein
MRRILWKTRLCLAFNADRRASNSFIPIKDVVLSEEENVELASIAHPFAACRVDVPDPAGLGRSLSEQMTTTRSHASSASPCILPLL